MRYVDVQHLYNTYTICWETEKSNLKNKFSFVSTLLELVFDTCITLRIQQLRQLFQKYYFSFPLTHFIYFKQISYISKRIKDVPKQCCSGNG